MNPLSSTQITSIVKRIDFIEIELRDLEEHRGLDFETYSKNRTIRRNVERIIENITNATIDIGKIMIASEDIGLPDTYKEVFIKLNQIGIIDKEHSENLSNLIRLRNILAHQYLDIKWEMIKDFIERGRGAVEAFLKVIKKNYF